MWNHKGGNVDKNDDNIVWIFDYKKKKNENTINHSINRQTVDRLLSLQSQQQAAKAESNNDGEAKNTEPSKPGRLSRTLERI